MVAAADFLADYPEFGAIDPTPATATAIVARFLAQADAYLSDSAFGAMRDQALELLTAHRLSLRYKITGSTIRNQNLPGVLATQNATSTGLSFAVAHSALVTGAQAWRADLARTNYGLELLAIIDVSAAPAQLAGSDS